MSANPLLLTSGRQIRIIHMQHQPETPGSATLSEEPRAALPHRGRAAAELAVLIILIEIIMWVVPFTPNPRLTYTAVALLTALFLLICHTHDTATTRALGLRFDNFFTVLVRMAFPFIAFLGLLLIIGIQLETLRLGRKFFTMLLSVPPWALLQQYLLLAFVGRRFQVILGEGRGWTVATAILFALLHLPNPVLVVACAAGGYVWARVYGRHPNLFANAVTHTFASAMLANSLPGWLLNNMVVGYNYFLR